MRCHKTALFLFSLIAGLLLLSPVHAASAQDKPAETATKPAEIQAVIKTLETPAAREELIRQLKIMARAQEAAEPESKVQSAASEALRDISRRLQKSSASVMALAGGINQIPQVIAWFSTQLREPHNRQMWTAVFANLAVTLGLGYLAFYFLGWGVYRFRRALRQKPADQYLIKALRLSGILVLDLVPILGFAVAAYLTLGLVSPPETTGLVALAWINAFICGHVLAALCRLICAPAAPGLRCSGLSDQAANTLAAWGARLGYVTVYGYFALQAALLLGLPPLSYEVLLRLLGLLVTILVAGMILQNREGVARALQQGLTEERVRTFSRLTPVGVRKQLALRWHLLALFYVILLYGVWALQVEGGFAFLVRATLLTLAVLLAVRLCQRSLHPVFSRGFRASEGLRTRVPELEKRANRYLHTLHRALNFLLYLAGVIVILQTWGLNTFGWLTSKPGQVLGGTLAMVFAIILVTFLIWEFANMLIESYLSRTDESGVELEASPRTRTLLAVARKALTIVLTVVSSLMVLSELGVDIGPLLAGAGVLGLAVGFGSQKLVQDVITGIFILLEDQIAVGDVINVGDKGGVVEAVSIRTVRLRDTAGTVHTIPFSSIGIVSNLTKDFSYFVLNAGVAYREDVDQVMQVLRDLGAELQRDEEYGPKIIEPLEMLGVDAFADSAVMIKARIKTAPSKQWLVGREFNRRMKMRFDQLGIDIPFPHTTIYFGEDKAGNAPPARLQVETIPRSGSAAAVPQRP
jgi:small-conductance mechanosensitive channel